jgi:phosphoribosyl-AMP cyclohydrolase
MPKITFAKLNGLVPVVIQDYQTQQVLMLGFMNKEAWQKTLRGKKVWFYSRRRQSLWLKGATSGDFLLVKKIFLDCDNDTLLILVTLAGQAVCHTGRRSCFYQKIR